jgi:hypothetical protein
VLDQGVQDYSRYEHGMFYLRLRWFFMIGWSIQLYSLGLPKLQNGSMRGKHLEDGEWNRMRFIDFFYGMQKKAKELFD